MSVRVGRGVLAMLTIASVGGLLIPAGTGATARGGDMAAPGRPTSAAPHRVQRVVYGDDHPAQFADLWLPADAGTGPARPVVVLVHGGFWRALYELDLMDPLAADLVARGYAAWNIEYRRVGHDGGGWPGTLADVASAIDELAELDDDRLDLDDVTFVGHSAGGHLAFWAAGRDHLQHDQPGADPAVMPRLVVGQGPVGDLVEGANLGAGDGAVVDFIGGTPAEFPERYDVANPCIGADVEVVVVRGADDTIVAAAYTVPEARTAVTIVDVAGDDHFDLIDPQSASWAAVVEAIASRDADRPSDS